MLDFKKMETFKTTNRIKIRAAIFLLFCILLPISSCQREYDEDGKLAFVSKKPTVEVKTEYNFVWKEFDPKDYSDWMLIICFIWPIPILIHRHRSKQRKLKMILWVIEPLLIGGATYIIYVHSTIFVQPAIGAYLAHTANGCYAIAWISESVMKIKRRKNLTTR